MIADHERNALIEYRLKQAVETIALAEFLLNAGKLTLAVNRIYYGMYYALTALALKNKFETSKHTQLIGWFNRDYISRGITDSKYGKILRNAYHSRTRGDYDAFVSFSNPEVELMLNDLEDFITEITRLIKDNPDTPREKS